MGPIRGEKGTLFVEKESSLEIIKSIRLQFINKEIEAKRITGFSLDISLLISTAKATGFYNRQKQNLKVREVFTIVFIFYCESKLKETPMALSLNFVPLMDFYTE